ncbi:hypothetical protein KY290_005294 [Solanum tuberosum]|uniref:Reverse transcriptase n=1 Tax=Solanum tuberosum TaxID=4113 RepID=A0ABQ7WDQ2_SOLTU|nr:hypothetical protein KY289_005681 [Solanum tuberosum]KAH0778867.1 hypothetical protein KY290_005294 [Solanum tuberosum]
MKILKAQKYFEKAGWSEQEVVTWSGFSIKKMYLKLRALKEHLQTRERLASWGVIEDTRCILCSSGVDSYRQALCWKEKVIWALPNFMGRQAKAKIFRMALSASVYAVWQERNLRIFQKNARLADINIRNIIQEVHIRGNRQTKLTSTLSNLDYYP